MKQAILITAYKDISSLVELINLFDTRFNFYIHIDKKRKMDFSILSNMNNVFVTNRYVVNWGGVNHLKAILLLANEALQNAGNSFFHLITAEDLPAKPIDDFLNLDITKSYLEYFEMPAAFWSGNGGFDRINYYQLYDVFNAKSQMGIKIIRSIERLQKIIRFKRGHYNKLKFFGGSTYWSLNRDVLQYVIDYTNTNKNFLKSLNYTFSPEEIYFQTIILNSFHAGNIINDNLRYIDWSSGRGGYPAFLDESDFDKIISSNKLFARKIKISDKLKFLLTGYCQKQVD